MAALRSSQVNAGTGGEGEASAEAVGGRADAGAGLLSLLGYGKDSFLGQPFLSDASKTLAEAKNGGFWER